MFCTALIGLQILIFISGGLQLTSASHVDLRFRLNILGVVCHLNILGIGCPLNILGVVCHLNILGVGCRLNILGVVCRLNILDLQCSLLGRCLRTSHTGPKDLDHTGVFT